MRIRNKKNGMNVLAYRDGASVVKEVIPAGATVDIPGLIDMGQVVNKFDFNRGWFEVVVSESVVENVAEELKADNSVECEGVSEGVSEGVLVEASTELEIAKEQAREYKKKSKNKK